MKIIDFESHYALDKTSALKVASIKGSEDHLPGDMLKSGPFVNLDIVNRMDQRLRRMDESGVTMQILSHQAGIEAAPAEESVQLARYANDTLAEVISHYPDRFRGWAVLPVKCPEAAVQELEHCIRDLGFFGWNVYSNFGPGPRLDDPMFRPILQKACELGCPVYLHPTAPAMDEFLDMGNTLWGGLGYTVDTQLTLTRLILSGALDELPDLKLFLGHLGEAFPFFLKRISGGRPDAKNQHDMRYYFDHNIWVCTSGNTEPSAYACTREVLGTDKILFATDFPMGSIAATVDFIKDTAQTQSEQEQIFFRNAEAFGL